MERQTIIRVAIKKLLYHYIYTRIRDTDENPLIFTPRVEKKKHYIVFTLFKMIDNYVNPVCCVAIVCHQVRCIYWGHLGNFHRAISQLKLYKIVCMRYLACIFNQRKSINTFSVFFCNLEFPDISFGDLLRFEHITSLFSCLCMSKLTPNSSGNMQKYGHLGCFHASSARENISGVWVIFRLVFVHLFRIVVQNSPIVLSFSPYDDM